MNIFLGLLILSASTARVRALTCDVCQSNMDVAFITDDAVKCSALKAYMTCLETATGAGCPIDSTKITEITTKEAALTTTPCVFADSCACQKTYFVTDLNSPKDCPAWKTRINCLKGKSGTTACDTTSTASALATTTSGFITGDSSCIAGAVCQCEIDYATADISGTKECAVGQVFLGCLKGLTGAGCGTADVVTMAKAYETSVNALSGCTIGDVCTCEVTYVKADISDDVKKCKAATDAATCLTAITTTTNKGCDGTSDKAAVLKAMTDIKSAKCSGGDTQLAAFSLTAVLLLAAMLY